jgi:hypothetical protein
MKIIGAFLIVLALVSAIAPQFLDCQSQGRSLALANGKTVPMKCHWSAVAELALGFPLGAAGLMMITSKRKETFRVSSIIGAVLGGLVIAVPTVLIGVCASNMMLCLSTMQPLLILTGTLTVAASLVGLFIFGRGPELAA